MKLSLICEAHYETDLAKKIIKSIADAHGTKDLKQLKGQVFTGEFLRDRAGIEEKDLEAAYKAELLVGVKEGHYKLSDKAFKLAGTDDQVGGRILNSLMGNAGGWSEFKTAIWGK
jgi:hypothetical protein